MIRLLQVVTPLHVGEGATVGAVDLPVARERHTGWPLIPGSALKGALRAYAARRGLPEAEIRRIFGTEPGADEPSRGAVSFGDAVLVTLAVRSLQGCFALVTSPLALARLGRGLSDPPPVPAVTVERALCSDLARMRHPELDRVVLEDLTLLGDAAPEVGAWAARLRDLAGDDAPLEHLVVVHDTVLSLAVRAWLPTRTRAAIGSDGVVESGKLFTTEAVPPESLFACTVLGAVGGGLPEQGEPFAVGGQGTIGAGRVAWCGGR